MSAPDVAVAIYMATRIPSISSYVNGAKMSSKTVIRSPKILAKIRYVDRTYYLTFKSPPPGGCCPVRKTTAPFSRATNLF